MENKFFKSKKNTGTRYKLKKNKSSASYPTTILSEKLEEKQLRIKNKLKTKFFSYYFKQWNSERWSKYLPTHFSPQYPRVGPHIIKNTKCCVLTRKNMVISNSNINSHIFKSLVQTGAISNLKRSIW